MKFIISLFTLVILTGSCNSSKEMIAESKTPITESKPSEKMETTKSIEIGDSYNTMAITYQSLSRGSFDHIQISKNEVLLSKDSSLKDMEQHRCEEKDWTELQGLLKSIDIETLPKLKAPTSQRLFDGAASATLSVRQGDMLIMTPSFDHGQPPKSIENLVNKVLSIKEKATKK